jgi:hypothetical protein
MAFSFHNVVASSFAESWYLSQWCGNQFCLTLPSREPKLMRMVGASLLTSHRKSANAISVDSTTEKFEEGKYEPQNISNVDIPGFPGFGVRNERRWSGKS